MTKRLEDLLADSDRGISAQFENFFTALQDVSNNPSAVPERQVLIGEANALALQVRQVDIALESLNTRVNDQLQGLQLEVNAIAEILSTINSDIDAARAQGGGSHPMICSIRGTGCCRSCLNTPVLCPRSKMTAP